MSQNDNSIPRDGKARSAGAASRRQLPPYRCRFCNEYLHPAAERAVDLWKRLFLFRTFQCPHCFELYDRPLTILGRLCLVQWFYSPPKRRVHRTFVDEHRASNEWSIGGILARFGRMLSRADRRLTDFLSSLMLSFIAVFLRGRQKSRPSAWRKFASWLSGRRH
ncbi:MAG: hypothetical protein JNL58_25545 [Planctomyces sp.]|nr:hypothetical protein [Planctomyces sp.]